jgi:hypothetical protein
MMTFPGPTLTAASENGKEAVLTDFTAMRSDLGWYVVNDNVMGGRSIGDFEIENGALRFTGRTNTNGGGFSSIRTQPVQLDLSNHTGIRLHVMGDGRRYTWRLTTNARWRGGQISYWADFETRKDAWGMTSIPFSSFVPRYRGQRLDGPALNPGRITGMGLMIYDKQDGPFDLRLASVQAYAADAHFTLLQYQWKKRVLVVSAGSANDESLRKQQNDLASTLEEFADRDMVLVTLIDDAVSTADGRELTTEDAMAAREALGIRSGSFTLRLIGKDGSVKLLRDTPTPMTEIYALIDSMPMRRREKSEQTSSKDRT